MEIFKKLFGRMTPVTHTSSSPNSVPPLPTRELKETPEVKHADTPTPTPSESILPAPTPLHAAVKRGNLNELKAVLESNPATLNSKDSDGATPLHLAVAVSHRSIDVTQFLISSGADINVKGTSGNTPLHYTAWLGLAGMAQILLNAGADVNVTNDEGNTPLHDAAKQGRSDVAEMLLAKGANVHVKNKYQQTPWVHARSTRQWHTLELLQRHAARDDTPDIRDVIAKVVRDDEESRKG